MHSSFPQANAAKLIDGRIYLAGLHNVVEFRFDSVRVIAVGDNFSVISPPNARLQGDVCS